MVDKDKLLEIIKDSVETTYLEQEDCDNIIFKVEDIFNEHNKLKNLMCCDCKHLTKLENGFIFNFVCTNHKSLLHMRQIHITRAFKCNYLEV